MADKLKGLSDEDLLKHLNGPQLYEVFDVGREMIAGELKDPKALFDLFGQIEKKETSNKLRIELIRKLATHDPDSALQLCAMIPPGRNLVIGYSAMIENCPPDRLIDTYKKIAAERFSDVNAQIEANLISRLGTLPEDVLNDILKQPGLGIAVLNNTEVVLGRLAYSKRGLNIPPGSSDMTAYGQLTAAVDDNPRAAADWIARNLGDKQIASVAKGDLLRRVVVNLAGKGNKEASEWAASLPENTRGTAVRTAIDLWLRDDSLGASGWAAGLHPGQVRSIAALAVAQKMVETGDMEDARRWAGSVDDPSLKHAADQILNSKSTTK